MGGAGDEMYLCPLYATIPSEQDGFLTLDGPTKLLPEWFLDLLYAGEPHFHVLLAAAKDMDDWGLTADIACYRASLEWVRDLYAAREGIDASIASCHKQLDLTTFRLGSACASGRLQHLWHLGDVPLPQYPGPTSPQ